MIRLKDIAQRAQVSIMTVSKVMRDAPDISPATKVRIRQLAEQMGYVPDALARGLRNRTTRLLGLIIPATTHPAMARIFMAVEEQAHQQNFDLILAHSLNRTDREDAVIRRFLARRVDGLFLSPVYRMEPTAPIYEELLQREVPTVLIGHRAPFCTSFVNVETDDLAASAAATRHLLDLGHRRIAFLAGPSSDPATRERLDGYSRALREAGQEPNDQFIFRAGSTIEDGQRAALQILQERTKITAIQAANDLVAIGAANILSQQGLKIPQEISLVGFGNFTAGEHYRVPLTTVRQPKFRLGVTAMELMTRLLRGEHPASKRLPAEILVRNSTAAPSPGSP